MISFNLFLVFVIGWLSQHIGLCMVRGVKETRDGKPEFLVAIIFSGVLAWVAIVFSSYTAMSLNFKTYSADLWFFIGGLLFGFGAAFNQGCGVSTLGRLSRGEYQMIFTVFGWLIGWTILAAWNPTTDHHQLLISAELIKNVLIALSVILIVWVVLGKKERRKLWITMMSIGLIGGFVFLYDPSWPPSGLLKKLSGAIAAPEVNLWPTSNSYLIFISLLLGMLIAAWHLNKFKVIHSDWRHWLTHLSAGTLMGIGSSLALGGNDSQLLLALPALSPAGLFTIIAMISGIWLGLIIKDKYTE